MCPTITVLALAATLALAPGEVAASQSTERDQTANAAAPELEPVAALQRMGAYLSTLPRFELVSDHSLDLISLEEEKIDLDGVTTYKVRTPDAFSIHSRTDRRERRYVYDGRRFTVQAPALDVYAIVDAPPTIRQVLDTARDRYGVTIPLEDLFHWGDATNIPKDIEFSHYMGVVTLDGVETDHYAYRRPDVDWQIWIQRGEQPLPLKMVIVDRTEAARPEYTARLKWNLNPTFDAQTFSVQPDADAMAINFAAQ